MPSSLLNIINYWPALLVIPLAYYMWRNRSLTSKLRAEVAASMALTDSNRVNAELAAKRQVVVLELANAAKKQDEKTGSTVTDATAAEFLRDSFGSGK